MALDIKMHEKKGTTFLEVIGRVVGIDSQKLAKKLESARIKNNNRIVIDISKTNFLDSHGLGSIIYYSHSLEKERREFIILDTNPDPNTYIKRLFELTNLDKLLKIVTNADVL